MASGNFFMPATGLDLMPCLSFHTLNGRHNNFTAPELRILECNHVKLISWSGMNLAAPYWRIYHNSNNKASLIMGGHRIVLPGAEELTLIAPESECVTRLNGELEHFYLHFDIAAQPYSQVRNKVWHFHCPPLLRQAISSAAGGDSIAAHALCCSLLMQIPAQELPRNETDPRIAKIIALIEAEHTKQLSNGYLASRLGMSTNAFVRLFRDNTGMPPQRHITETRLRHACILLRFSGKSIDEIAAECGFCDRFHFSRMFSKYRETSPAAFRRLGV